MPDDSLPPLPPLPEDDETRTLERASTVRARSADEPPRRRTRDGDGPRRRQWSAGHAVIVSALALAIGLVLNAPGIHKSAYNKSDGWQRDVAIAFTGPLADLSHALLLDRPRKAVQAVVGRSDADDIDTEIALPVAPPPT